MEIGKTVQVQNRQEWREWLAKNFEKQWEIWLVLPKKESGKPMISYNDSVEEALCFGWIDSIQKTLNETATVQRFSKRKPKSGWSQPNRERLRWLFSRDMVHPKFREEYQKVADEPFEFPQDILTEIKKHEVAWQNYQQFSEAYKRIRIAYIEGARKRPEEFRKRLNNFIRKTDKGKVMGYGGIEKYY